MLRYLTLFCLGITLLSSAQSQQFSIQWEDLKLLETAYGNKRIPSFNSTNFNYNDVDGLRFFAQWPSNGYAAENTARLTNLVYETISRNELGDLNEEDLTDTHEFKFRNTSARLQNTYYIELKPIIKVNNQLQRLTSFTVDYKRSSRPAIASRPKAITNSVLNSGEWYKFYIEETGVHRISKSFLSNLGIEVNTIDPRTIKLYGHGGQMLPYSNAENFPFDPVENAIRVVGEADGRLDDGDFILFYAEAPSYNEESDTHVNLYAEKTYYYINISSGQGKRLQQQPEISLEPTLIIENFEDEQFYEVDEFNLAKLGRRWYGDRFDIENQRTYEFDFPNLDTSRPAEFRISLGSVSENPSSMAISINGNQAANLNFNPVDLAGSVLATSTSYTGSNSVNGDNITVTLDYNNGGNPSANAFLDYINIRAYRGLIYNNNQLIFKNSSVASASGTVQYNIANSSAISDIWDITDRYNISSVFNDAQQGNANVSFKAQGGELRSYIAFSTANTLIPKTDGRTAVANQNLKGTILKDASGQFQDVDYLIITPSLLRSEAERLAEINREQNNLVVKVITLQTIYNEFSMGSQDIAAIRNFIKYVYDNASSPTNRLKYVCLFGEGSYDYKNRIRNNTNLVPTWYSLNSSSLTNSFVSDDFYAMLDANEGQLGSQDRMDVAVGRILAESPQRAREMVDKIQSYYNEASFGSWRNNVLLISDDVDVAWEKILQETTDGIGTTIEEEKPFINVFKIHTDAFQQESSAAGDRYPQVNKAMRDAIEVGALVVNYFGHGGEDGLAKERIFDKLDAQNINNICKYNCFVTVTCEYTKFDDPNRVTAGEFTFWNTNGGAIALITTTRQIFVTVGVVYNEVLDDYLFAFGSNEYPSMAEALRLTKIDPNIAGISQKRLVFFIGDPAMKLAFPKPEVRLTHVNDVPLSQPVDTLKALSYAKLKGEVTDEGGNILTDYNGTLLATIYDKSIERQTLANDNVTDGPSGLIKLDFTTLGEIIFKGQASIENGVFEFDFVVPRDIGIPVGNGKVSFYAQKENAASDEAGASFEVKIGGINENAPEDNVGPVINLFMNDENFVSGGITNRSPNLIAKLQDDNGINTASGIGHDIVAILDNDETNPIVLNSYYEANLDDYTNGNLSYALRNLEPGPHTLSLKAWDVYNNSSTADIQFTVFDENEELKITNVLNYPNPFVDYTEFWFNHNSSEPLDVSIQIFTVSGKLVKTLNGQTSAEECCQNGSSSLSRNIIWDGRDDFGDKIGKGVYVYKLKVKSNRLNKQVEKIQKLVIL